MFCAGHARRALDDGAQVRLLWATAGGLAPARRRLAEGARVLAALGLPATAAVDLHLPDQHAVEHVTTIARAVGRIDDACGGGEREREAVVYVPAYEGGHPDHDAVNLAAALAVATRPGLRAVEFPLYRRGPFGLTVQQPLQPRGRRRSGASSCRSATRTWPCGAPSRAPTRASSRRRFCPCWRWRGGRAGGGPNRPAPCPPTTTPGRLTPAACSTSSTRRGGSRAGAPPRRAAARRRAEGARRTVTAWSGRTGVAKRPSSGRSAAAAGRAAYGRGTNPMRSRTLAMVRSAMAAARSAPSRSTSRVKPLSAPSSFMRRWNGASVSTTTSARSFLNSA